MNILSLLCLPVLIAVSDAFYENDKDIVELLPATFQSKVVDSDDIWIVEFYAPWCGHCKSLVSDYSQMASAVRGLVRVGAVNADQHQSLGQKYDVSGFPTLLIFGGGANQMKKPRVYQGARTAQGMVEELLKEIRSRVTDRLGGRRKSGAKDKDGGGGGDVIELTDASFDREVLGDDGGMWLVEFYAPWCGHCQRLTPHWAEAASQLKGKVKMGALDATQHTITAAKYNIRGFPTIKFFPRGPKDGGPEDYEGGRTASDIVAWATEKVADAAPPPPIQQLVGASVFGEACQDRPLCVVSVLPHILDCPSGCRNDYLKILEQSGNRFRKNGWGWVWSEAMQQPTLEEALGIGGFGYPALAVVNARKMKFSLLLGPFSYEGISEHIRAVSMGRGSSSPLKGAKLPNIQDTQPWDGKDGQLPVEEDIDLSDVNLDDQKTEL